MLKLHRDPQSGWRYTQDNQYAIHKTYGAHIWWDVRELAPRWFLPPDKFLPHHEGSPQIFGIRKIRKGAPPGFEAKRCRFRLLSIFLFLQDFNGIGDGCRDGNAHQAGIFGDG